MARVVKAAANAADNFKGCRYRLLCVGCSKFRGYVGVDLEQHLADLLRRLGGSSPLRPIVLGARKTKKQAMTRAPAEADYYIAQIIKSARQAYIIAAPSPFRYDRSRLALALRDRR